MSKQVVLVVNGTSYADPYQALADELDMEISHDPRDLHHPGRVALVVFTGGEDVHPSLYGKSAHKSTYAGGHRDKEEVEIFKEALYQQIPFAGICRGAQLLCVLAGGELVQDLTGHHREHLIKVLINGQYVEYSVSSSHHQNAHPFDKLVEGEDFEVIGEAIEPLSYHYSMDQEITIGREAADLNLLREPDIIWYNKINALAVQYHPEWLPRKHPGYLLYQNLLNTYIKPLLHAKQARTTTT